MYKSPSDIYVRHFFQAGKPQTHVRNAVILHAMSSDFGIHFIDTGFVKVYSLSDQGEEYVHIILGPGDIYPLVWAYLDIQPDIFYEALTDCLIWRLPKERFTQSVKTDARLGNAMAEHLARQLFIYSDRIENLEYKKPSERLAYRLLFLANRFGVKRGRYVMIDANLTHEVIANSINLARETVSREFERLAGEGLVDRVDHKIIIKDMTGLNRKLSTPNGLRYWQLEPV